MRILIAGDYSPRDRVADILKGKNGDVLAGVIPILKGVDYSIANFESTVETSGADQIAKIGPGLRCTKQGVKALKDAGFNCVTLANNHFRDYGDKGIKETLQTLKCTSLDYVGGGMDITQASLTLYKDINGQKLAIINCCEHEFSIATDKQAGCNPLNPVKQYYAIREAKTKADRVLVIVHGGHEHFQLPSPRMVETYRFFIDAGADTVINHHQHCYSGYEVYNEKPIFYGIGNFCFDHPQKRKGIWTEGYLVTIDFSNEKPSFEIHPYKQCAEEPIVDMLPKNSFDMCISELNKIIENPDVLVEEINKYYNEVSFNYSNVFEPLRTRLYIAAKRRGWLPSFVSKKRKLAAFNYINCESHREKMLSWLKKDI